MSLTLDERDSVVARQFDRLQDRFRDRVEPDDFRLRAILDVVGDLAGRRVLDLGCGKGRFASRLLERGANVVGLDPSHSMLAHGGGFARVRGSGRRLPFPTGGFEAAISVEVLQHVGSPAPILREVHRVLRPGGRVLILDRNALALDPDRPWLPSLARKWIDEKRGLWMYPSNSPIAERWFTPGRLASELRRYFEIVRIEFVRSPRERGRTLFDRVPWVRQFVLWEARKAGDRHGS